MNNIVIKSSVAERHSSSIVDCTLENDLILGMPNFTLAHFAHKNLHNIPLYKNMLEFTIKSDLTFAMK